MGYTLEELMKGLPKEGQMAMAIHFAELALPIWTEFAAQDSLTYIDGVVGMQHVISATLPMEVLTLMKAEAAQPGHRLTEAGAAALKALSHEFVEPIVALQDDDWDLPEHVKLIFYAHSNLLEYLNGHTIFHDKESALYVVVNQAMDGLEKSGRMDFPQLRVHLQRFSGGRAPSE
jgi:hypothetical protein